MWTLESSKELIEKCGTESLKEFSAKKEMNNFLAVREKLKKEREVDANMYIEGIADLGTASAHKKSDVVHRKSDATHQYPELWNQKAKLEDKTSKVGVSYHNVQETPKASGVTPYHVPSKEQHSAAHSREESAQGTKNIMPSARYVKQVPKLGIHAQSRQQTPQRAAHSVPMDNLKRQPPGRDMHTTQNENKTGQTKSPRKITSNRPRQERHEIQINRTPSQFPSPQRQERQEIQIDRLHAKEECFSSVEYDRVYQYMNEKSEIDNKLPNSIKSFAEDAITASNKMLSSKLIDLMNLYHDGGYVYLVDEYTGLPIIEESQNFYSVV